MKQRDVQSFLRVAVFAAVFLVLSTAGAWATIEGITGPTFHLSVATGNITTADGGSYLIWGFANQGGVTQYPGPTLIVNEGQLVQITLRNNLTVAGGQVPNVSMVFPGHDVEISKTDAGVKGMLTSEAIPGGTVTYKFRATNAGTYTYYSGTDPALQIEMGLVGVIIVRQRAGAIFRVPGLTGNTCSFSVKWIPGFTSM
jgi:FtsP/CotA-like multicopper oxidase with cupredoxin domain